ncbi:unnamed protein product [Lepeophtheirus salmonis]|uniref:(salmon louse) hypothetical protein n=1 Tax=Lepeophtheirus salmonis TaxID=72036 RepID=A0A0K2TJK9_LEPSM|nr:unnamed protein product [Lepeophtheirus salmonis]CAF2848307.1 unnamed protein product [Lepeophtheirus salmonis]
MSSKLSPLRFSNGGNHIDHPNGNNVPLDSKPSRQPHTNDSSSEDDEEEVTKGVKGMCCCTCGLNLPHWFREGSQSLISKSPARNILFNGASKGSNGCRKNKRRASTATMNEVGKGSLDGEGDKGEQRENFVIERDENIRKQKCDSRKYR